MPNAECFIETIRTPPNFLRQRLSADKLHHQKLLSHGFFDTVNRRNIRMIERRENLPASGWNLPDRSPSRENSSGKILIATSRFSFASRPR
jgi:hypothetical protein